MVLHPEIQEKARREVERVVGPYRVPTFADCDAGAIPYLDALVLELLRWHPIAPLGALPVSASFLSSVSEEPRAARPPAQGAPG